MLTLKSLLLSFLFMIGHLLCAYGGGWPQAKGGYFVKLSEWWLVADQHFNSDGTIIPNIVNYGYYSTSLYAEYGFSQRLTALFSFPFLNYTYTQLPSTLIKRSIWKPGDADIGLRYAITYLNPIAVSVTFSVSLPFGYNENEALQTGYGKTSQLIRIDASNSWSAFNSIGWISAYTGFNNRTGGYADEMHFGLEGGYTFPNEKLTIIARMPGVNSVGNDENADHINPQSLFSNQKEYLAIAPEIIYHINSYWGITLGAGAALSGKNIFASPVFSVGVFNQLKQPQREKNQ